MKTFKTEIEANDYSINNPTETVELKSYWTNGKILEHYFYVDGKKHGEYKDYYRNGQLDEHCFYVNGLEHGECKSYYGDGQLEYHCFYVNGDELYVVHLKDSSYKSLCIKHTLFNGNVIDEDI